jgi:1-deoxy-D-xylulose-5-phosphate reductoisomerase
MRLPIALALGWPDRVPEAQRPMDWTTAQTMTFEPLDDAAFPAVALAREAGRRGGSAPAAFNAANEEAVAAFLDGRLAFVRIVDVVESVVTQLALRELRTPADVLEVEDAARASAQQLIGESGTCQH